jgi:hypothetical protein
MDSRDRDLQAVTFHELAADLLHARTPVIGEFKVDQVSEVPKGIGVEQQHRQFVGGEDRWSASADRLGSFLRQELVVSKAWDDLGARRASSSQNRRDKG